MTPYDFYLSAQLERDIEEVRKSFPFIVERLSYRDLELDIGDWLNPLGEDIVVISKIPQGPKINFPPVLITYGFKNEADAIAFKIRFECL